MLQITPCLWYRHHRMARLRELLSEAIIPILRITFLLIVIFVMIFAFDYAFGSPNPLATIVLPSIVVTAPTTELTVAIAEMLVAIVLTITIFVEALPFLSDSGRSITAF